MAKEEMRNKYLFSINCISRCFLVLFFLPLSLAFSDQLSQIEKHEIVQKLDKTRENINSIRAALKQEKCLKALKDKISITGTVILQKPRMFRIDTVEPFPSYTAFEGNTMTIYHPDINEAEIYDLADNTKAQYAMKFFSSSLWSSLQEMEKEFHVTIYRSNNEIVFELSPLSMIVSRYLTSIVIHYEERTGIPLKITSVTPKGDTIVTTLTNIEINPELKSDTFTIKLPEDVWIITADK